MAIVWSGLIVLAVAVVASVVMLFVRARAPHGGFFESGDRAVGVFGVLATGFAVLLGFVVFLAFESYDTSRSGAETEAQIVTQQFATAQLMPAGVRGRLSGELVCYARSVVRQEWPRMQSGTLRNVINPWGLASFSTINATEPRSNAEQAAYGKWLDQRTDREDARSDRLHGSEGVIPAPLWLVLFLSAIVMFAYMLLFADPRERAVVQVTMMASVAVVIASTLVLLWFLDNPYHRGLGGLPPVAMKRTLSVIDRPHAEVARFAIPCDAAGSPRRA